MANPGALLLTADQLKAGQEVVFANGNRLTGDMIDDLIAIFRGYLGELIDNYDVEATFLAEIDTGTRRRCAKLAACLVYFQENQFTPASGFAPTLANRTGFNYSMDGEIYKVFQYAWGLFWNIPPELEIERQSARGRARTVEGVFLRMH